ncbi:hypothetical protein NFI96_016409 [Prochilodus magdalenae]|nr:hypothetical protein NFI96_016409 [Prochilodus magdalenae]
MGHLSGRVLAHLPILLALLAWFRAGLAGADGRVFLLELRNGSDAGFEAASRSCEVHGARVASGMELRHSVLECAFSACARGWLTGPNVGHFTKSKPFRTMLRIFYESVVASAILYAVACWGSRLRVADANRLNKLIRKASDVVGVELDSLMAVSERRTLSKLQTIMDNGSHPLYHTVMRHRSTFSARLIQPKCTTERHRRTTVCRSVAGSLRAVDMRVDNVTESSEPLAAFCVKDTGAPCGAPPSFPNTHLQGQTGLELGDELLYSCNPGYTLPNGETAFSLLCDSCGEWYGLVQLCIKDNAEAFIDYEDKLPDDHHLYDGLEEVHRVSLVPEVPEITDHEEEQESTPEPKQDEPVTVEEEVPDEENPAVSVTEPPVSQLSQKHMFWFPSEAFQEEEHSITTTETPIKAPTHDVNYIPAKTDDRQPDAEITTEEDVEEYVTPPPTDKPISHSVGSTDESWLDGYPISQEEEKAGAGSTDEAGPGVDAESDDAKVEEFETVTHSPEEAGAGGVIHGHQEKGTEGTSETSEEQHTGKGTDYPEEEETEAVTEGTEGKTYEGVFHEEGYQEVTDAPQGKISDGVTDLSEETQSVTEEPPEEVMEGEAKGPAEVESKDAMNRSKEVFHGVIDRANDVEMSPTSFTSFTQITSGLDDVTLNKRPMPYTPGSAPENVSTSQGGMGFDHAITPSGMAALDTTPTQEADVISNVVTPTVSVSWETKDFGHFLEQVPTTDGDISVESHDNQSTMEGDKDHSLDHLEKTDDGGCGVDPCQVAGRGPTIAAIIVGLVAAVVGVALGVWCYKRRQQKSSHYQLNGTNRQTQCIELQQTV